MENAQKLLIQGAKTIGLFESRLLLAKILNKSTAQILAFAQDYTLNAQELEFWNHAIQRRQKGEPFFYILGEVVFDHLPFFLNIDVLIPRPETEFLLFKAIEHIEKNNITTLLDCGTGSGILAICLKKRFPFLEVFASDWYESALKVARHNAQKNQTNITFLRSYWFENIPHSFDLIVSNPPYIAEDDPHLHNLQFEPQQALIAQENGTADLKNIIQNAPLHLNPQGALFLEHGHDQGHFCQTQLRQNGFIHLFTQKDWANLPRISGGFLR